MTTVEFDAKGKVLGRLACEIANAIRGKNQPSFRADRLPDIKVVVKNVDLIAVTGNKEKQKLYYHFSGYPGGLKKESLEHLRDRQPTKILTQAISRMLPKNRLRPLLMRRIELLVSTKS
jgi:large subunit ribosomal protein L13